MLASKQIVNQIKLKPECLVNLVPKAGICLKSELPPKKTYNWPYEKYSWNLFNMLWDPFTKRKFNENSKIIQVEGNVKSGKQDFAQRLADKLGMKYLPPVDLENLYINEHGYDYRALNPLLPERLRICDLEMFHENPSRHSNIHMQNYLFKLRVFQYIKALTHIFNTGQGVVMSRSAFTDRVFVEAMHNVGWLPMGYLRGDGCRFYDWRLRYNFVRNTVLAQVLRPHLTIYLETPIDICLDRIRNSSDPVTRNSKALIPEFLEAIERAYKDVILPKQENHSHVLSYDYTSKATEDELMDVIDDIKELNFDFDVHDLHFVDWDDDELFWYASQRRRFTTMSCLDPIDTFAYPSYDIAGMGDSVSGTDMKLKNALFQAHVGPYGYSQDIDYDLEVNSPLEQLKIFLKPREFGKELDRQVRVEFA